MGRYIKGQERDQLVLFPTSLEDMIEEDNEVRVIDTFVESLDMKEIGIERAEAKKVGAPGYDPRDMLKLYLYGYKNKVRSSRKLMELTKKNIEVMWLIKQIKPDFRSISDFRKNNKDKMKKVFLQFNLVCKDLNILDVKEVSQDGTKIRAVNSKERNFTLNKIDDRIKKLKEEINEYLKELETTEEKEAKEKLVKVEELKQRQEVYEMYREEMEREGENQKSLTDKEAKLMKDNGAFHVCYNLQTLMGVGNHFVINYEVTDQPADYGSMAKIIKETEEMYKERVEKNITDKGYNSREDMLECLENGTIPEVTPERGKEEFVLEEEYEENEITESIKESKEKEDIKKCLKAGVIPKIYEGKIEKIEVKEVEIKEYESINEVDGLSEEELRDKAMKEKVFVRDREKNIVYCPEGSTLRQKSKHKDRGTKYCNKLACKNCKNPCTSSLFKEAMFKDGKDVLVPFNKDKKISTGNKVVKNTKRKSKKVKKKKVFIHMKVNKDDLRKRMCTSEHNHGSMKRWDDAGYMLLKGKEKVTCEVALYYCAFNIRRAIKILGVTKIVEYFKEKIMEKKVFTNSIKICIIELRKIWKTQYKIVIFHN